MTVNGCTRRQTSHQSPTAPNSTSRCRVLGMGIIMVRPPVVLPDRLTRLALAEERLRPAVVSRHRRPVDADELARVAGVEELHQVTPCLTAAVSHRAPTPAAARAQRPA